MAHGSIWLICGGDPRHVSRLCASAKPEASVTYREGRAPFGGSRNRRRDLDRNVDELLVPRVPASICGGDSARRSRRRDAKREGCPSLHASPLTQIGAEAVVRILSDGALPTSKRVDGSVFAFGERRWEDARQSYVDQTKLSRGEECCQPDDPEESRGVASVSPFPSGSDSGRRKSSRPSSGL